MFVLRSKNKKGSESSNFDSILVRGEDLEYVFDFFADILSDTKDDAIRGLCE